LFKIFSYCIEKKTLHPQSFDPLFSYAQRNAITISSIISTPGGEISREARREVEKISRLAFSNLAIET